MSKIAFVTGGRKGIGFAIAEELTKDGFFVVVSGRENRAISFENPNIAYLSCDNRNLDSIRNTADTLFSRYGKVDLLVNNAGVAPKERVDLLKTTEESFDFVVDTNLKGGFFMCQAFANHMIEQKQKDSGYFPRIVNISSVSAYTSSTNRGEYCISKAGLSMVTSLFADRLAEYGIPVFEVRPGIILTDMTEKVKEKYQSLIENGLTPIKRIGRPEDVAQCVSALAGGKLDFAIGQVINADGGFHIRRL